MTVCLNVNFFSITCDGCGITYAMPQAFHDALNRNHKTFFCPNGCERHYPQKSDIEQLKEKLKRSELELQATDQQRIKQRIRADSAERSNQALKGVVTRTKKRIAAGCCPCCKRTFQNLRRHISTKHPGYSKEKRTESVLL